MLKKFFFIFLVTIVLYMLLVSKEEHTGVVTSTTEELLTENPLLQKVLTTALSYQGTPYKFGGTTKKGMDCSGLVFTSYKNIDITLARSSKNMYFEGEEVSLEKVKKGDLLFFDIDKFQGRVNHVGMVTEANDFEVKFIHATTKKGVIISSINESYWKKAFIKAKRILNNS